MDSDLEGYAELERKLAQLASPREGAAALKESVRKPMQDVMKNARWYIARISPGEADYHKTYKGRIVGAGFAARSMRVVTKMSRDKSSATAMLGVRKEAFYAVQFFELGTAYIEAKPWLVPAFENKRSDAVRGVGDTLRARIEKIAKSKGRV